jgi:hypothetical protein
MAMFLIERNFPQPLEVTKEVAEHVTKANTDVGVQWLHSYLVEGATKTYCLYEAPSADLVREAAGCAGIPADVVVAVAEIGPEQFGVGGA